MYKFQQINSKDLKTTKRDPKEALKRDLKAPLKRDPKEPLKRDPKETLKIRGSKDPPKEAQKKH